MPRKEMELHPAVLYGQDRGWNYEKTAKHLRVSYERFKGLVRGFRGVSVEVADSWERISKGRIRSIDVLRWHARNRRSRVYSRSTRKQRQKQGKTGS